jgi:hypothetical protein
MPIAKNILLTPKQKKELNKAFKQEINTGNFRAEANHVMAFLIDAQAITRGNLLEELQSINGHSYVGAQVEAGYITARFSQKTITILQKILDIPLQAIKRDVPTVNLVDMLQYQRQFGPLLIMSPGLVPPEKVNAPLEQRTSTTPVATFTETNKSSAEPEQDRENENDNNSFIHKCFKSCR